MNEPSVLDYIKSKLNLRKNLPVNIPPEQPHAQDPGGSESLFPVEEQPPKQAFSFPWRSLGALLFGLIGQRFLEPPDRSVNIALFFYALAILLLLWAMLRDEWRLAALQPDAEQPVDVKIHWLSFYLSVPIIAIAFIAFGGNRFTPLNLILGFLALGYLIWNVWIPRPTAGISLRERLRSFIRHPELVFRISPWMLLMIAALLLVLFFRFYRLGQVPGEMFSDHAEKLLDVADVLQGKTSIFFPRNTGREAIQFYLTAAIALLLKTGLSFISLKIGTALCGLFTLPYIYLLGKELGGKWVGFFAFVLAGFAYWPNLIARIGLRFPLYPLFVAPALFYLIRGLRTQNRNDFILAGIAVGLGLHGYSPFRFVPFVLLAGISIYLLHRQSRGKRWQVVTALVILGLVAFVIFLPLFRYALSNPDMFGYRTLTRLGTTERAFPESPVLIFLKNFWKASIMFFWSDGNIWVHSVTDRPALDVVTAVLYLFGVIQLLIRYIRKHHWLDLFLLISVPLLMMPSILSLAFPDENPSLNRTGGAIIPVFIIAALALEGLLTGLNRKLKGRANKVLPILIALVLLWISGMQNYDLVFNKFDKQFMAGAWNTSDMGRVIKGYASSVGSYESAYVVPFPYWVDTRLVAINAGNPLKDYALWPEQFAAVAQEPGSKLILLKPEDADDLAKLKQLFPSGSISTFNSALEGKNFTIFLVPAAP